MQPISVIAEKLNLTPEEVEPYGKYKAKIRMTFIAEFWETHFSHINEPDSCWRRRKSTVTVGLGDALTAIGKKTAVALREDHLGPTLGLKGGATGGGDIASRSYGRNQFAFHRRHTRLNDGDQI